MSEIGLRKLQTATNFEFLQVKLDMQCSEYNRCSTNIFFGTKTFKKDYLDKHIGIKEHKKAMEKYTNRQPDLIDIMSSFTIQAENLAIEAFPNLMELTNLQIQNKTELVYNKSPITVSPPIFGPKRVISDKAPESLLIIEEDILAEVRRSPS
ncbi:hypothetical protein C2G38_2223355 [Gigaspora rosea]|uniref:Uncharacterized protein n=1 Tax=Gigaspora rosea TaxID=44941 RepID=A0A397U1K3_9GLOM|nr:hypothetical protein C2G38_2223355 [Gigaspora rosea]